MPGENTMLTIITQLLPFPNNFYFTTLKKLIFHALFTNNNGGKISGDNVGQLHWWIIASGVAYLRLF